MLASSALVMKRVSEDPPLCKITILGHFSAEPRYNFLVWGGCGGIASKGVQCDEEGG